MRSYERPSSAVAKRLGKSVQVRPYGAIETLQGRRPLGGFGGNSGRVKFSPVLRIQVR